MIKPYLNGGCGNIILPAPRPDHHTLVPETLYSYPIWVNADRNEAPGVNQVIDLFKVPWCWPDNYFEGALFSHFMEHLPHNIVLSDNSPRAQELAKSQDLWFAVWAEIHRVLSPGAMVHVICPYATSHGYLGDPTHCRPIVEQVFYHSMVPNPDAPFTYNVHGIHFEVRDMRYTLMPAYAHLLPMPEDPPNVIEAKATQRDYVIHSQWNVISDIYVKLECIK